MYTSGLLILTNDGKLVNKLTHPRHEINKTYIVKVEGIINSRDVEMLQNGVEIENNGTKYITKPAIVKILNKDIEKNTSDIEITIHEGKNRQIRKMCEAIRKKVIKLHRNKIGNLELGNMKYGEWRYITLEEIEKNI